MASKKPNKEAVEKRIAEMKQAMLNVLKEMPIIEVAVKRIGISRDTFYRWKLEDKEFEKQSQKAMAQGIDFINDMSESQIISLIKEKKMPSIRYWLKHNHPKYRERLEITTVSQPQEELNAEQEAVVREALRLSAMPEVEIKTDEGYEQKQDNKTSEQTKSPEKPAEEQKPINPMEPIRMTPQEIEKFKGPITRPIIVKYAGEETTYMPNGEKMTKIDSGGTCYCPPNPGHPPMAKPLIPPKAHPNQLIIDSKRGETIDNWGVSKEQNSNKIIKP